MKYSFEEWLSDEKCESHTNNGPEGFEKWLEDLDTQEIMDYAQEYGAYVEYETLSEIGDIITIKTLKAHKDLKHFRE